MGAVSLNVQAPPHIMPVSMASMMPSDWATVQQHHWWIWTVDLSGG